MLAPQILSNKPPTSKVEKRPLFSYDHTPPLFKDNEAIHKPQGAYIDNLVLSYGIF